MCILAYLGYLKGINGDYWGLIIKSKKTLILILLTRGLRGLEGIKNFFKYENSQFSGITWNDFTAKNFDNSDVPILRKV